MVTADGALLMPGLCVQVLKWPAVGGKGALSLPVGCAALSPLVEQECA